MTENQKDSIITVHPETIASLLAYEISENMSNLPHAFKPYKKILLNPKQNYRKLMKEPQLSVIKQFLREYRGPILESKNGKEMEFRLCRDARLELIDRLGEIA